MINAAAVRSLMGEVLSEHGLLVQGFAHTYGIDVALLARDEELVRSWVADLPGEFLFEGGGGWSALNLCQNKDGSMWTGAQMTTETLFVLASALGMAKFLAPKEMWSSLPGGMPYVVFTLTGFPATADQTVEA
jgi:hypothetical protein